MFICGKLYLTDEYTVYNCICLNSLKNFNIFVKVPPVSRYDDLKKECNKFKGQIMETVFNLGQVLCSQCYLY